ncbi:MAG: hypothetical protein U1E36_02045 [Rickettsiales bacterium]
MSPRMHLIAVGVILLIALIGLFASGMISFGGADKADSNDSVDDVLITVGATWGENCNDYIESMNENPSRDEDGNILSEKMVPVKKDNVLRRVASMCDTRAACAFPVGTEILGPDPAPGCTKALIIDYRCGEMGATQRITAYSGSGLEISCKSKATD